MKSLATFLTSLTATQKGLSALLGAVAIGVLLGASGIREPLNQIKANTESIKVNSARISDIEELRDDFDHFDCLIRLQLTDSTFTAFEVDRRCPRNFAR